MIEELGAGGMATVYRARDRELRREVAIKVLFPHLCRNREVVARFQREARAAAGLDHPHILRVFDVGGGGEAGGDPPYIVLELVRGPNLAGIVEGGALVAELAASCGVALASALAHAHKAGVIHRDIKPANLLVAEGGRLVLADFGVARVAEDDSSLVTKTGALLGTPAFMSPEQATGGDLDARSDLYSVGATLYQLATGSLPVSGNAARAVAAIVAGEVVPPLRRNPTMGKELAQLIERLMAVEPAARVASAGELEAELRAVALPIGEPEALLGELFADRAACEKRIVPLVVASSIERAKAALEEGNTARALGLCDRALALDPRCDEANAIVESIGARRMLRRVVMIVGVLVLLGAAGYTAWAMWPSPEVEKMAVAPVVVIDGAVPVAIESADAAPPPEETEKQATGDGQQATGDRRRKKEKKIEEVAPPPPERADAAPVEKAPEKIADAVVTVQMDTWCDLSIDGEGKGRAANAKTIALRPGRHDLACTNPDLKQTWTQSVELAAGDKRTVKGTLVPSFAVKVKLEGGGTEVLVDKQKVANGGGARLKRGSHRVEVLRSGKVVDSAWVAVRGPCTLVDRPAIACR